MATQTNTQEVETKRLQTPFNLENYAKLERLAAKSGKKLNPFVHDALMALVENSEHSKPNTQNTQSNLSKRVNSEPLSDGEYATLTEKIDELVAFKALVMTFMGRAMEIPRPEFDEEKGREMSEMEKLIDRLDSTGGDLHVLKMRFDEHKHHADGKLSDPRGERMAAARARREAEESGLPAPAPAPVVIDPAVIAAAKAKREAEEAAEAKKAEAEAAASAAYIRKSQEVCVVGMIGEIQNLTGNSTTVIMLHATQAKLGQEPFMVTPEQQVAIEANDAKAREIAAAEAAKEPEKKEGSS